MAFMYCKKANNDHVEKNIKIDSDLEKYLESK